jgi:hypothetical protein
MLKSLREQVALCYRRAGECKELAELATSPNDKAFYLERERGWLLLARSYELDDRSVRSVVPVTFQEQQQAQLKKG